jgi:hypothetical protein
MGQGRSAPAFWSEALPLLARRGSLHCVPQSALHVGARSIGSFRLHNKPLQLTPNSAGQSIRGTLLAAEAVPQRWRSALFGAAERRSVMQPLLHERFFSLLSDLPLQPRSLEAPRRLPCWFTTPGS